MSFDDRLSTVYFNATYGASLVGSWANAMMFGLTTLQTYFYYRFYPKDSIRNKSLVGVIWVLDCLQTCFACLLVYTFVVFGVNNRLDGVTTVHWPVPATICMNVVVSCLVQSFFSERIFQLCNNKIRWILCPIIWTLILCHFGFGLTFVIFSILKPNEHDLHSSASKRVSIPFGLSVILSDLFICASLCFLLHGSRSAIKSTNAIVTTLITYAINRCIITSIGAAMVSVLYIALPGTLWSLGMDFVIGKLYANSLLAALNSRASIRARGEGTVELSDIAFDRETGRYRDSAASRRPTTIGLVFDRHNPDTSLSTSSEEGPNRGQIKTDKSLKSITEGIAL